MKDLPILLRRELWEHRGGFLWTPLTIALLMPLLAVISLFTMHMTGNVRIQIGSDLTSLLEALRLGLDNADLQQAAAALDMTLVSIAAIIGVVLFFVLFFYLLGALYDDRRDRSVLFWKSLPVSDTATVASKVIMAAVVVPLLAVGMSLLGYLALLAVVGTWAAVNGLNLWPVLAATRPLVQVGQLLLVVLTDALWSLPTIGWLLLCSAWVRGKPFLWAVLVPGSAFLLNGWLGMLGQPHLSSGIVAALAERALLGLAPAASLSRQLLRPASDGAAAFQFDPRAMLEVLGSASLWIGVLIGLALLAAATWARARRIDTST